MNKDYICPDCGEPCDAKECDDGIGPYEYHGQKCYHSHKYIGSDCCEAELVDVPWPDDGDRADWAYEQMKDRLLEEQWEKEHGLD